MSNAWIEETTEEWYASVYRSGLDDKVWVPTIPGQPVATSEAMAATSLRRVKAYVEQKAPGPGGVWTKLPDGGGWEYHVAGYVDHR